MKPLRTFVERHAYGITLVYTAVAVTVVLLLLVLAPPIHCKC